MPNDVVACSCLLLMSYLRKAKLTLCYYVKHNWPACLQRYMSAALSLADTDFTATTLATPAVYRELCKLCYISECVVHHNLFSVYVLCAVSLA